MYIIFSYSTMFLMQQLEAEAQSVMGPYSISSSHTVNEAEGKVTITRTFGELATDTKTELLDKDCANSVSRVLSKTDTTFSNSKVDTTIAVNVNEIDDALTDNIVFDPNGATFATDADTTEGTLQFCLKSTSIATWGNEAIEMSTYKGGYVITYRVEDTFFVVTSVTESEIDNVGEVLDIDLRIVAQRCSEGSEVFSGNANTIVEGEIYYLCLKVDGGTLSNISLDALFGVKASDDEYSKKIDLIDQDQPSLPIIVMSEVGDWTQISVPIVAAFLQGDSELKLSGSGDIAFAIVPWQQKH